MQGAKSLSFEGKDAIAGKKNLNDLLESVCSSEGL